MREELAAIETAISTGSLPHDFSALFGSIWNKSEKRFDVQESFTLDFKEVIPTELSDSYGSGIVRLALAFYNGYGGLIVFGVRDKLFDVVGVSAIFEIEKFNRLLTDVANITIECQTRTYDVRHGNDAKPITVL